MRLLYLFLLGLFLSLNSAAQTDQPEVFLVEYPDSVDKPKTKKNDKSEPGYSDFVPAVKRATPTNMRVYSSAVIYHQHLKDKNIQGKVILKVLVNEDGMPTKYSVVKNPNNELTQTAVKPLHVLKFEPAELEGGKKVKMWVVIPVDFKLK